MKLLKDNNLYCRPSKYKFEKTVISFLEYKIFSLGMSIESDRLKTIIKWPIFTTIKQLQFFLEFTNFIRKFGINYSETVKLLTNLTKKGIKLI